MKNVIPLFGLAGFLAASIASAQDVSTTFTLGTPTADCIAVQTQDGVSTGGQGAVCPTGFFGGAGLQISLPQDPINPGNALNMYQCSASVVSNTVPVFSKIALQPPGSLVQSVVCGVEYPWFTATWSGTLTYNYDSVKQRHCSSGRAGYCVTAYYPVWASGSGTFSTPPPPPKPPPPPQPTVSVLTLQLSSAPCDLQTVCELVPTDHTVVASATLDMSTGILTVLDADGSVRTSPLAFGWSPNGDDGDSFTISGEGPLYDKDGNSNQTVDLAVVTTSTDGGPFTVASGTLDITTTTPPALALTLGAGSCDENYVCTLQPTDPRVIASAELDLFGFALTLDNADGTQTPIALSTLYATPNDPAGLTYTVTGSGGTFDETVDFTLQLSVGENEVLAITGGTLNTAPR